MNKTLSFLAVLFLVTSTAFATTPDEPASGISVLRKGETFKLLYKGARYNDVKIYILNEDDEVIFSETIKSTDGFIRPYNFSKLPEGNYSFELVDNKGRHEIEQVNYRLETQKKVMHVVQVGGTTDKFVLSVPNSGQSQLAVNIYDDKGRVMYAGSENIDGDFAKVYNIKDHSGRVTFEVIDSKGKRNSFTKDSW
jgi:flagellar hook assembly protein FlgD